VDAYLGLGSNLGDRAANLRAGLAGIARRGLAPLELSSVWETEPVDSPEPVWFLNMVARTETDLPPLEVLDRLLDAEREAGRVRTVRNAPRVLDLDLLLLGDLRFDHPRLTLPHPRMWERRFVLSPLAEIAPGLRESGSGRSVREVCESLPQRPSVRRLGPLASLGSDSGV
jgi:2-amino-4-hydroxy-6-hydroxymethyldihydropteridine diphosphokinase